jgi:uncharacterized protein (DUF58 family)
VPVARTRPTGRGWGVLALAAAALALGVVWRYPGLVALGGLLAVVLVVDALSVRLPGALSADRVIEPLEVNRYGECTGTLSIVHTGRPVAVTADGVEPVGDEHVPVPVGWLRPGQRREVSYVVPTTRRGRVVVGPLRLRRYGFAALTTRSEEVGAVVTVRVLPRVLPVRGLPTGARRGHVGADERVAHGGTDLVGLHEDGFGDDLRRVHWATSARTGTLMVREDADPARPHLAVVLDDRAASYADPAAFEHAVEVAASLAWTAGAAGHPVRVRGVAGPLDVTLAAVPGRLALPAPELLSALADVSLEDSAGSAQGPQTAPGDLDVLVVVTGAGADLAAMAAVAARAQLGAVLVVDPQSGAAAAGPVVVLRGPGAEALLADWDRTVGGP